MTFRFAHPTSLITKSAPSEQQTYTSLAIPVITSNMKKALRVVVVIVAQSPQSTPPSRAKNNNGREDATHDDTAPHRVQHRQVLPSLRGVADMCSSPRGAVVTEHLARLLLSISLHDASITADRTFSDSHRLLGTYIV